MAPHTTQAFDLHRAIHQNLRLIREGESKSPSSLFDQTLQHSAQVVLMLAADQELDLDDRIQLLFESGDYAGAQRALDEQMSEWAWHQRWLFNRRHGDIVRAIRRAVATEPTHKLAS